MSEELIERVDRALDGLLSKAQCRSMQYHAERWMGVLAVVFPLLVIGQFYGLMFLFSAELVVVRSHFILLPVLPALVAVDYLFIVLAVRWRNRTIFLRIMRQLKERGIRPHLCLNCEYDLKGSVADHCPECGVALAPVDAGLDRRV
jgi:hypothetical protein